MDQSWWLLMGSGLSGALFFVLLAAGLIARGRRGRWFRRRGFAMAEARAAERFARGEVDEATYRLVRDDLRAF